MPHAIYLLNTLHRKDALPVKKRLTMRAAGNITSTLSPYRILVLSDAGLLYWPQSL